MSRYAFYALSFLTNATILVFEITGGRLLAPYIGNSVGVWAGLIAVILGGMAIGYHFGGVFGDKDASLKRIGLVLLGAAAASLIMWGARDLVPTWFVDPENSVTTAALIVGTILFMPTVILLAAVSPLIAKNLIHKLDNSAKVVGELNAVGTAGSILGAAGTGLWLIPNFGVSETLLAIPVILFLASLPFLIKEYKKLLPFAVLAVAAAIALNAVPTRADEVIADVSTPYNRIFVYRPGGGDVLGMADSPWGVQCAMRVDENGNADESDVSFSYLFAYDTVVSHFFPEKINRALFLGGCVLVFPRFVLTKYPDTVADAVEIDPGVTQVARDYFGFDDARFPTLTVHHEDARTFINADHGLYDVIAFDVWNQSGRPTFYLVSREAFKRISDSLAPNGIAVMHVNSAPSSKKAYISSSTFKTASSVFKYAAMYQFKNEPDTLQNLIVVLSNDRPLPDTLESPAYPGMMLTRFEPISPAIVFTDDFAPVDGMTDWDALIAKELSGY
jgi:spermidine synthase